MTFEDILCSSPEVRAYKDVGEFCRAVVAFAEKSKLNEAIQKGDTKLFHEEFTRFQESLSQEHNIVLWQVIGRVAGQDMLNQQMGNSDNGPPHVVKIEDIQ